MKKNQSGQITIDFLFSLLLAFGAAALLFSITFTLGVVEATQYVVYSAARAQAASNQTPQAQENVARNKYQQLAFDTNSPLASLYQNGWFTISSQQELDVRQGMGVPGGKSFSEDLAPASDQRRVFMGVSTKFQANIMKIRLPFLGSTNSDDPNTFATNINAILIREPSQFECQTFFGQDRLNALSQLPSSQGLFDRTAYVPMEDNGC